MTKALVAHNSGDLIGAKKLYEDILKHSKEAIGAAINLSAIRLKTDEPVVELLLPFANEKAPAELWFNLGLGYKKLDHIENAQIAFENTLILNPNFHTAKYELAKISSSDKAILLISEAIKIAPQKEEYWLEFAILLSNQGELIEAAKMLLSAFNSGVQSAKMLIQLGLMYWNMNDLQNAKDAFEASLQFEPDNPEALWQLSLLRLKICDFEAGWSGLWTRFHPQKDGGIPFPKVDAPVWGGEYVDSLLIVGEQGFGDNIQFARFIPELNVGKIYFAPRKELVTLFNASDIIAKSATIVDINELPKFNAWIPIMELAAICGANQENIPYKNGFLRHLIAPKNKKPKVGLVWQGNPSIARLDKLRSLTLKELEPLFDMQNIDFISLQQGYGKEQLDEYKNTISDSGSFSDFLETANFIDSLDLVITIDSSVAHLSAAMNKPTWIMLPFVSCWRWSTNTTTSYWYNSVKLFRQTAPNGWSSVIAEITEELKDRF
ncbi:MAG: hypothetical protein RL154_1359 [Pseudomonadota bacterium]|jgi:hypothetical protein